MAVYYRRALVPIALLLCACREVPTTQILVVVDTNIPASVGLTEVHVEVRSPNGTLQQERGFDLPPSGSVQFPFSFGVVPQGDDASRRVRIIAEARGPSGQTVVRRSALCGFFPDTILRLPLYLPDVCRGLVCPEGTTCRGDSRTCVSDEVDTLRLERIPAAAPRTELDGGTQLPFAVDASTTDTPITDIPVADIPVADVSVVDTPVIDAESPDVGMRDVSAFDAGASFLEIPSNCPYPSSLPDARVMPVTSAPRLIAPLSLGRVTKLRPTLRWTRPMGADAVRVELCEDRGCRTVIGSFTSTGESQQVPMNLPPRRVVFWRVTPMVAFAPSGPPSAVWYFVTPSRDLAVDTSGVAQTDLNGDGYADLGVIACSSCSSLRNSLALSIYHGGPTGFCLTPQSRFPFSAGMNSVVWATAAGDFDGDGFGDLAYSVTALGATNGTVVIKWGGPSGLTSVSGPTLVGNSGDQGFGIILRAVGDVNRDGYADLAVTVNSIAAMGGASGVRVFFGGASGLQNTMGNVLSRGAGSRVGIDIAPGGVDIDGDGFHDLVTTSRNGPDGFVFARGTSMGLGAIESRPPPDMSLQASNTAIAAGDLNADGKSDLVYVTGSENGTAQGVLAVYLATGTGLPSSPTWFRPAAMNVGFLPGISMGDSNGDDRAEVFLVESLNSGMSSTSTPRVLSLRTDASELVGVSPSIDLSGVQSLSQYSGFIGDADGDGFGDNVIGTAFVRAYGFGGFVLFRGGPSGWSMGNITAVPVNVGTLGRPQTNQVFP